MATLYPTVCVLDLTARLGLHALEQLGVANPMPTGHWSQLALCGLDHAPRIDWYRPVNVNDPLPLGADAVATILIAGPGSAYGLRMALERLVAEPPSVCWVFLMPNALMEEIAIRSLLEANPERAFVYRLPDSQHQTFWFILMEQLAKLVTCSGLLFQSLQPPDSIPMNSNLKQSMEVAMSIDGALAVALVDYRSGMCLAQAGGGLNLELAAAGNTEVVRAKLKTVESLGLRRGIEDILITLGDQYHLIRLVPNNQGLFLYLVLDKAKGNLALARYKLTDLERTLKV